MTEQPAGSSGPYGLANSWTDAGRRLALIGECLDPCTRRRIDELAPRPGWHCLDVGAGGGSVAAWLAGRAGPTGRVLATDIDTRFLDGLDVPGLEVWRHDVARDPLPERAFDLIHTRSVLIHLPDRDRIVGSLAAALRPDGWLLLEESDFYPIEAVASVEYRDAWRAVNEVLSAAGMETDWAHTLPVRLAACHLVDVAAEAEVQMFAGGSPMAEMMRLTFAQVEDLVAGDAARRAVRAATEALADPARWFPATAVVGCRGRRPPL
jgi:SAM-dependent methyltransferase